MARKYILGLTGNALRNAQLWAVILPAYTLFGWNNGVAGPLLNLPSWIATFPAIDTVNATGAEETRKSTIQGTTVAMYTLGAFFGALSCIWVGDKLGRVKTIQVGAAITAIGALLEATSFSLAQLIVARLVTGFGFGELSATAPNWQSECSSAAHRGAAVILESLFISLGLALSGWVNLGMSFTHSSVSWRFPLAMTGFWALIVIGMITMLPESPRWLLRKGRTQEATEVLATLNGVSVDDPKVHGEVREILGSLEITGQGRFADMFEDGELRLFNRTCLACAGQMFQQMSGINALAFYQTTIWEQYLGLDGTQARILSASVFTFQTICSPIGVLTVDRFGRRKLMIVAALGMGMCMVVVAGTSSQSGNPAAVGAAGAFIFLFSLFFPVGFLGLTFLYASEISPLSHRVPITSMSTGSAWLFNFLVAEITPTGFATIGWRYYIIYACINWFLIVPSVYFFFPETNGRHLEEVDQIFRDSSNVFGPVKMAKLLPEEALHDRGMDGGKAGIEGLEKAD
ncbi:putative sugar transporter [Teratosphaeria nubilosa]|uniref:Putative sugar transporter n=1 Tax=Teratosphaeria nubilosa TaxID=161662 RepID=A0A6G1LBY1_9PEZI|nr:putative sugar transporter [Teratosphaeria nubilosa]